jgi:hypothetical protein
MFTVRNRACTPTGAVDSLNSLAILVDYNKWRIAARLALRRSRAHRKVHFLSTISGAAYEGDHGTLRVPLDVFERESHGALKPDAGEFHPELVGFFKHGERSVVSLEEAIFWGGLILLPQGWSN